MSSFEGGNMQTQYNVLSYRIDLYFHDYKPRNLWKCTQRQKFCCQKKRQKAIEQEPGCKAIRIDPDKEDFDVFRVINEIFRYIKQPTKKL